MKIRKFGVAVLGVGRWGVHFVRNFLQHSQTELVAVVDTHPNNLTPCQQKFDLDSSKVLVTTNWLEVKQLTNLDAIVVATPATTHYEIIKDALQSGYHVLAEKPLTLDPLKCIELAELATNNNLQLLVDHTYLFNAAVVKGQEIITSGELGELRYGYATRTHLSPVRQDVDALWDLGIHDLAIFNYWLGQTPFQVQAKGQVWLQPNLTMPISTQKGLADMVWVTLNYPSGFHTQIHLSWLNPDKQRRLCVVGSRGTLIFDEMSPETPLVIQRGYFTQEGSQFIPQGVSQEVIAVEPNEPLSQVCDRFIQNIISDRQDDFSSGKVGATLVNILRGLTLSLEQEGKIIKL
jgi:predicted dehydrogenase